MSLYTLSDRIYCVAECACSTICKYYDQYKDPDDLEKEHCSVCPVFEKASDLIEELGEEDDEL